MSKKVMLGTKFKRCVQHHELRATDCYFLGGFVRSNLSKPCAVPSITFLILPGLARSTTHVLFVAIRVEIREIFNSKKNWFLYSSKSKLFTLSLPLPTEQYNIMLKVLV